MNPAAPVTKIRTIRYSYPTARQTMQIDDLSLLDIASKESTLDILSKPLRVATLTALSSR
jgi:hypothetical protein